MLRLLMIAVFSLSVVAMWTAEASAGCIKLAGGGQYCADWITGSEICQGKASGIKKICDQTTGECAGEILCAAGGVITAALEETPQCNDDFANFPSSSDACVIPGKAFCINPNGQYNPNGQAFNLEGPVSDVANLQFCTKNGNCRFFVELDAPEDQSPCNNNWTFEFTASTFKALSCFCPGEYDLTASPPACVPSSFDQQETCLIELCTVDLTNYQPGETRQYSCQALPAPPQ